MHARETCQSHNFFPKHLLTTRKKKKMGVKAGSRARTSVPKKKIRGEGLACQRACCAGESCFRTHFRNGSHGVLHLKSSHYIGFTVHVLRH
jgi:hypothetical protein